MTETQCHRSNVDFVNFFFGAKLTYIVYIFWTINKEFANDLTTAATYRIVMNLHLDETYILCKCDLNRSV